MKSFSLLTIRYIIGACFYVAPATLQVFISTQYQLIGEIREKTKASGKSGSKQAYH
ncbi:hypothetical protein [Rodentibacter caecimuris]|uniref:hypothetical protein n=1 Tax=Rodentibacter caecimuris TaxID=1796644 RepID=UPI0008561975|nr:MULTISPECIES: hypothetical protein [Pasteurellaceae]AOF54132.1 hypothetical protein AC062_2044 [Pasteurellaceae bacterium NI1060]MCQ9123025.1 hypothetical protein [Rodentibacter heylii]MCR1836721.1 hypothetical protein [Pasteurella caecimuris]MCX2961453.1 hypothetical protein [Rodentibacter heylii]